MSQEEIITLSQRVTELREAFDRSFSIAPNGESAPTEAFLAIHVANDNYALRLTEISGLYVDKKVVPLPGGTADLFGISSFRGTLVPVYDLRVLLGYSVTTLPRWLVLIATRTPFAVAFDQFDGYLHLPRDAVARAGGIKDSKQYVADALRIADQMRPIVSIGSILESIKKRAQQSVTQGG